MYILGSFQRGRRVASENPLEEVWSRVAQFGVPEWVRQQFQEDEWATFGEYATVRVRQAVEFRRASAIASLLTTPLPMYYSFLNLSRGLAALGNKRKPPAAAHGLQFVQGTDLLTAGARISNGGTFPDLLRGRDLDVPSMVGRVVMLKDALAHIAEVRSDFAALGTHTPRVVEVDVVARRQQPIELQFRLPQRDDFRVEWSSRYPSLSARCTLAPEGTVLHVQSEVPITSADQVADFCEKHLWPSLMWSEFTSVWYAVEKHHEQLDLPRDSWYYLAMFILGSCVRYEPELMLEASRPESAIGWFLTRFLRVAERFYPQLALDMISSARTYYTVGA